MASHPLGVRACFQLVVLFDARRIEDAGPLPIVDCFPIELLAARGCGRFALPSFRARRWGSERGCKRDRPIIGEANVVLFRIIEIDVPGGSRRFIDAAGRWTVRFALRLLDDLAVAHGGFPGCFRGGREGGVSVPFVVALPSPLSLRRTLVREIEVGVKSIVLRFVVSVWPPPVLPLNEIFPPDEPAPVAPDVTVPLALPRVAPLPRLVEVVLVWRSESSAVVFVVLPLSTRRTTLVRKPSPPCRPARLELTFALLDEPPNAPPLCCVPVVESRDVLCEPPLPPETVIVVVVTVPAVSSSIVASNGLPPPLAVPDVFDLNAPRPTE